MSSMKKKKNLDLSIMPKGTDLAINISILILAIFGLLMISSASMGIAIDSDHVNNALYLPLTVAKQGIFLAGGYVLMRFLASKFNFSFFSNSLFSVWIIIIGCALFEYIFSEIAGGNRNHVIQT